MKFDSIEKALNDLKNGKMIILADDVERENEGDLVMPAEDVTSDDINFMAKYGRGLICAPIENELAKKLDLPLMVKNNDPIHSTGFTVSIDHKLSGTGISCESRALTLNSLADPNSKPEDFIRPGHIFPLISHPDGLQKREGHTEATISLLKEVGKKPVGVICEIMKENGDMARRDDLFAMAKRFDLSFINIREYRHFLEQKNRSQEIYHSEEINFPNDYGDFKLHLFETEDKKEHHLALVLGDNFSEQENTLVRIHSECLTGDVFRSQKCDCGEQLEASLNMIAEKKRGILVYLRQEGRGIGLANKIKAYKLQQEGFDTVDANRALGFLDDLRDYKGAAKILKHFDVKNIELLTNNPLKIDSLKESGFEVVQRKPLKTMTNKHNQEYLKTKKTKMHHLLDWLH